MYALGLTILQSLITVTALDWLPGCILPYACHKEIMVKNCITSEDCCAVANAEWLEFRAAHQPDLGGLKRLPLAIDPYVESLRVFVLTIKPNPDPTQGLLLRIYHIKYGERDANEFGDYNWVPRRYPHLLGQTVIVEDCQDTR